jgi:hypothetical protein
VKKPQKKVKKKSAVKRKAIKPIAGRIDRFGLKLENKESDIEITFPDGRKIMLFSRFMSGGFPTLDIILPEELTVATWQDENMALAPALKGDSHVRTGKQICVELPPSVFRRGEKR